MLAALPGKPPLPVVTEDIAIAAMRDRVTNEASAAPRDNGLIFEWFHAVRTENPEMVDAIDMVMEGAPRWERRSAQIGMATAYRLLSAQATADEKGMRRILGPLAILAAFVLGGVALPLFERLSGGLR